MATVYFSPVGNGQTFFNSSGVALAGGQIFTYIAGTTTPIATYTDSLGTVPNSNPIILNSAGQLSSEIWITQSVKLIIKDSLGVTIQTIDNIPAINNVSGTVIEWVASGLTPTYVSTTSFTVGGDQRAVFTKYRRLQITVNSGTVYGYVLSATFVSGITTIVVVLDSGVLDSGISLVSYGFVNPSTPSLYQNATVSYSVAISANAGTFTLLEKSVNLVDITGTLTASGNITTTFPTDSAIVEFNNSTLGDFSLTVNSTYYLPKGKSSWSWNGSTFTPNDIYVSSPIYRNRFINGDFTVSQVNASSAVTVTAAAALQYVIDQWYAYCTGANVTGQRVAGSGQSQYRYQFTGAASVTKIGFAQRMEASATYDMNGQQTIVGVDMSNSLLSTVTWTAWYANTADTFGTLASPTRTQIGTGTITVSSALARYYIPISIPAAATTGIEIEFSVGAQISGTWVIGRAQFELSTSTVTGTPFEFLPYEAQLRRCQRYYYKISVAGLVVNYAANLGFSSCIKHPVTMRIAPTSYNGTNFGGFVFTGISINTTVNSTVDSVAFIYNNAQAVNVAGEVQHVLEALGVQL